MFKSVLVVCVGNICRSPMGEAFLKQLCQEKKMDMSIASAGIGALVGHAADKHVIDLMQHRNIDVTEHHAQQLTESLAMQYELMLVMEKGHVQAVNQMILQTRGRVHLLGKWNQNEEIPDPYQKSDAHFVAALSAIERNIQLWGKYL